MLGSMRRLSTTAAKKGGIGGWLRDEVNRSRLAIGLLAGTNLFISLQLTKVSHAAQEREETLRDELRAADRARRLLLARGPDLAREAGLPVRAMGQFDAALRQCAEEAASPLEHQPIYAEGGARPPVTMM